MLFNWLEHNVLGGGGGGQQTEKIRKMTAFKLSTWFCPFRNVQCNKQKEWNYSYMLGNVTSVALRRLVAVTFTICDVLLVWKRWCLFANRLWSTKGNTLSHRAILKNNWIKKRLNCFCIKLLKIASKQTFTSDQNWSKSWNHTKKSKLKCYNT